MQEKQIKQIEQIEQDENLLLLALKSRVYMQKFKLLHKNTHTHNTPTRLRHTYYSICQPNNKQKFTQVVLYICN